MVAYEVLTHDHLLVVVLLDYVDALRENLLAELQVLRQVVNEQRQLLTRARQSFLLRSSQIQWHYRVDRILLERALGFARLTQWRDRGRTMASHIERDVDQVNSFLRFLPPDTLVTFMTDVPVRE